MSKSTEQEKRITAAGIEATVIRKRVKNVRVTVLPPDGTVRVTAPNRFPELLIKTFLTEKADWIRSHQEAIRKKYANEPRGLYDGKPVLLFGTVYPLCVREHQKKNGVLLEDGRLLLLLRGEADEQKRETVLNDWYRERLKTEIEYLMPLWSEQTGLYPSAWTIRDMSSRWGSCNTQTGRITLNLQLVKYPLPCLQYVILHELAHLKVRGHGADFKAILDRYMPSWRALRKQLNH